MPIAGWDAFIQWAKEHFRSFRHVDSNSVVVANNKVDRANNIEVEEEQGAKMSAFASCRQPSTSSVIELRPTTSANAATTTATAATTSTSKVKTVFVEERERNCRFDDEIMTSQV